MTTRDLVHRHARRGSIDMEVLLLAIYAFFVWLIFFKFKWLRWTTAAAVVVITIPIFGLAGLMLLLNVYAPSALDVQVVKYVVQVLPRVTGRVIEVPVEPNRLVTQRRRAVPHRSAPVPVPRSIGWRRCVATTSGRRRAPSVRTAKAAEAQIDVSLNRVRRRSRARSRPSACA